MNQNLEQERPDLNIQVTVKGELFSFTSQADWIAHAKSRFGEYFDEQTSEYFSICVDAVGRICTKGSHFKRAEKEQTYPVKVYEIVS